MLKKYKGKIVAVKFFDGEKVQNQNLKLISIGKNFIKFEGCFKEIYFINKNNIFIIEEGEEDKFYEYRRIKEKDPNFNGDAETFLIKRKNNG